MTISKYKEGELIWSRSFGNLERDPIKPFDRMKDRLHKLGYFFESGYDYKRNYFWIVVGGGDNCLRFGI